MSDDNSLEICNICFEPYNVGPSAEDPTDRRPVLTPNCCGNTLCMQCAESSRATKVAELSGNRKRIPCPLCNEKFHPEYDKFIVNRFAMDYLEKIDAVQSEEAAELREVIKCDNCKQSYKRGSDHDLWCPSREIKCPHHSLACEWEGNRKLLESHIKEKHTPRDPEGRPMTKIIVISGGWYCDNCQQETPKHSLVMASEEPNPDIILHVECMICFSHRPISCIGGFRGGANILSWDDWYALLKKYREREGDCLVSRDHFKEGNNLGDWVWNQRRWRRKIPIEWLEKLDEIDFCWDESPESGEMTSRSISRFRLH